jgi:MOB kinase activator 1
MDKVQMYTNDPGTSFKQRKTLLLGQKGAKMQQIAVKTLGTGVLQLAVQLPQGEDLNEWLALNTLDFYNEVRVIYSTISEVCTELRCPKMSAGPKFEYLWVDGVTTPEHLSAPAYIESLMNWVEEKLDDEELFPAYEGRPFSHAFVPTIRVIFKRLFRVYAHMYHSHFLHLVTLGLVCHLNTSFKHFLFFIEQFKLVSEDELVPLEKLVQQFRERSRITDV